MAKNLYIIRHGQTDLNSKGIVQGRGIDSPLNEVGIQQAQAFFNAYKEVPFDRIYISRLQRTFQTVQPFVESGVPFEIHPGLDEIGWGIYEGREQSPEIMVGFQDLIAQWSQGSLDCCVEGGESPNELMIRQKQAIDHIMSREDEQNVLICMHGRAMRILLAWLTGLDPCQMDQFPHTNTALYKIQHNGSAFDIVDRYNIQHLETIQNV